MTGAARPSFTISPAESEADIEDIARLFLAYSKSLNIDLSFQSFESELSDLPGKYAEPHGVLLLARDSAGQSFGCVGIRPLSAGVCEMKRLYVNIAGRGSGAGRALAEAAIATARRIGYDAVRLDTLASMQSAIRLYQSLGFREINAYYATPLEDTVFLELRL